ncbi:MAG: hypothetical protein ACI3ZV_05790, partial [Paludibacteraceae bacterium]
CAHVHANVRKNAAHNPKVTTNAAKAARKNAAHNPKVTTNAAKAAKNPLANTKTAAHILFNQPHFFCGWLFFFVAPKNAP